MLEEHDVLNAYDIYPFKRLVGGCPCTVTKADKGRTLATDSGGNKRIFRHNQFIFEKLRNSRPAKADLPSEGDEK